MIKITNWMTTKNKILKNIYKYQKQKLIS